MDFNPYQAGCLTAGNYINRDILIMNAYQPLTTLQLLQKQVNETNPDVLQSCILTETVSENGPCLSIISKHIFTSIFPNILDQQQAVRSAVKSLSVEVRKNLTVNDLPFIDKLQQISKRTWGYLWDKAPICNKPVLNEYIVRYPPLYSRFFEGDLSVISHILSFLHPKLHARIINDEALAQTVKGRCDSPTLLWQFLHLNRTNTKGDKSDSKNIIIKSIWESIYGGETIAVFSKNFYRILPEIGEKANMKTVAIHFHRKLFDKRALHISKILCSFKSVVKLSLENCSLNFHSVETPPSFSQLQNLTLNKCLFDIKFINSVLASKTTLKELHIRNCHKADIQESNFSNSFKAFEKLSRLTLVSDHEHDKNIPISDWKSIQNLHELVISGVDDFTRIFLPHVTLNMQKLHLINCFFDAANKDSCTAWAHAMNTAPIEELSLENCRYSTSDAFIPLNMQKLKRFSISGDAPLSLLSQIFKADKLVQFELHDLEESLVGENSYEHMKFSTFLNLETLLISTTNKRPTVRFDLSSLVLSHLKSLTLDKTLCDLTPFYSPSLNGLVELSLNSIDLPHPSFLGNLIDFNSSLKKISLINQSITYPDLVAISKLTHLQSLFIENCTPIDISMHELISCIPTSVASISLYKTYSPTIEFFNLLVYHLPLLRRIKFDANEVKSTDVHPFGQANVLDEVELVCSGLNNPRELLDKLVFFGLRIVLSR